MDSNPPYVFVYLEFFFLFYIINILVNLYEDVFW